ncbi:MAG: GNAT family N-acetyltransferase [Firmicutes bacterium]|nr:GNAT family N-acetyltransferase [Bacillota bacterium]
MDGLALIYPDVALEAQYMQMLQDWRSTAESMFPFVLDFDPSDFPALITKLRNCSLGIDLPPGFVPHTTLWLVDQQSAILGVVNIRHYLDDKLRHRGGHIGYGIRPSQRRRGLGTKMLALALNHAKTMGLDSVLLTCDKANIASDKVIQNNGGKLDSEEVVDGTMIQRYWIEVPK